MPKIRISKRRLLILVPSVVVLAGLLIIVALSKNKPKVATIVPKDTSGSAQTHSATGKGASTQAPAPTTSNPTPPTDTTRASASLTAPSGQLGGTQPPPNNQGAAISKASPNITANCATLAGASCIVRLTSPTNQVLTISPSTNDGQGNFTFNWSGQDYQSGTWKVELVATKGGATGSADIGPLVVYS